MAERDIDGERLRLARPLLAAVRAAAWSPADSMETIVSRLQAFLTEVNGLEAPYLVADKRRLSVMLGSPALGDVLMLTAAIRKSLDVDPRARRPEDRGIARPEHLAGILRALPVFAQYLREMEAGLLAEFPSLVTTRDAGPQHGL